MKRKYIQKLLLSVLLFGGMFFLLGKAQANITNIGDLAVGVGINNIYISWTKPALQETEGIAAVRKENSCPSDASDGKEIYRGSGNGFVDETANKKTTYCYGVYVYDASGATSRLKISGIVRRQSVGEYTANILENNFFMSLGLVAIAVLAWLNVLKRRKEKHKSSRI